MKNITALLLLYTFLISGCCTYCAEGPSVYIGITLYDKDTGDLIQDNVGRGDFQFTSQEHNHSFLKYNSGSNPSLELDLSLAKKKSMEDILTLKWWECNCIIAELAVEYELHDNECCDTRSVKVKNIKSVCTNPNLEFVEVDERVNEIKIMVEL